MKKLLITVGGTGGHIYPAIAVAKELKDLKILFAGGKLKSNPYFDPIFPYAEFSSATFEGKNPIKHFKNGVSILKGIKQSRTLIRSFQPDLILGFGSFYTFPMLLAAKWTGTPFILHEANRIPGKVNRLMGPYAKVNAIHFPDTSIQGRVCEVGMPLRFKKCSKDEAYRYYGLDPKKQTLLVFGGSQGALAINQLFSQVADWLPEEIQVIHLTGKTEVNYQKKAVIKPFENNMAMAWQAADLVISRAGASTIAEQLEFEVPAILIPYPYATDNHQDKNADFIEKTVGGGIKISQREMTKEKLLDLLKQWIENKDILNEKRERIVSYKGNRTIKTLASLIRETL